MDKVSIPEMAEQPLIDRLREMILEGQLLPGERVTEAGIAERLGVSRTPVRNVLPVLASEGLLSPVGRRGYAVSDFSNQESMEALELRALLEGYAARLLARRGASEALLKRLKDCLIAGDKLLTGRRVETSQYGPYGAMNAQFHNLIVEGAESAILSSFLDRTNRFAFVHPGQIVFDKYSPEQAFDLLFNAHGQHHAIFDAIVSRDGARAEEIFREHAVGQRKSMFDKRRM